MRIRTLTIAMLATAAAMTACNSGSKNQTPDGWVIKNDVWKVESIDFEEIAKVVDIKPIVSEEPIAELTFLSGCNNDFIASDDEWQTFYHIKDGRFEGKLNAVGNGPNEYNYLDQFSYLPADGLLYGFDSQGKIMCFKTSPFKFETKYTTDYQINDMFVLGHDHLLLSAWTPAHDSSAIYEFDGLTMTKVIDMEADGGMMPAYVWSGNEVLISAKQKNTSIYRYAKGQMSKVATIDNGDMEMSEDKILMHQNGNMMMITWKDHTIGCKFAYLKGSTLAYWHFPMFDGTYCTYLTIATRDNTKNYKVHIGGLNVEVRPGLVDNGVYTMLIQGDWESKINADEEMSETGKRIIEAMKGNDYNPVILQFKLKTM